MRENLKEDLQKHLTLTVSNKKAKWQDKLNEDPENYTNSLEGRISNNYLSGDYPHFLRPNKLYPYRRLEDHHIKNAMEEALERYEKDLLSQDKQQQRHREDQLKAHNSDLMYIQDQEEKKARDREETRLFLKIQMEEARVRREKEYKEAKEKIRTHFGPEEDVFTADFQRNLDNSKKSNVKETLQK